MLKTLILVGAALVFCILFLPSSTAAPQPERVNLIFDPPRGRVLGVSETIAASPLRNSNFSLPENQDQVSFKFPNRVDGSADLYINARNAYLWHPKSGEELFGKHADQLVPIASITKLLTALTFLDLGIDWEKKYTIQASDMVSTGHKYVYVGETLSVRDLYHLSLISSANSATRALVKASGIREAEFIKLANNKLSDLGFINTTIVDPIGLSAANVSTASELARLLDIAFKRDYIAEVVKKDHYRYTPEGKNERVAYTTNLLLKDEKLGEVISLGGKTGFTNSAGSCFIGKFKYNGEEIISVVLGASSNSARFTQTKIILDWMKKTYSWE